MIQFIQNINFSHAVENILVVAAVIVFIVLFGALMEIVIKSTEGRDLR